MHPFGPTCRSFPSPRQFHPSDERTAGGEFATNLIRPTRPAGRISGAAASDRRRRCGTRDAGAIARPTAAALEIIKYCAVDDVGRAANPMIIDGQTHGGIVQGVGQALQEQCFYDAKTGQLLSGSFMDYATPRADAFPFFDTSISEVPTPAHPLGIRPAGEGGTTPALAVMVNAIVDALRDFGVRHVEMPATAERIWRAIHRLPASPQTLERE